MLESLVVKSNVKNRLQKIRNGIVYNDMYAVIDELFQNSYRARATKVNIDINADVMIISDNGKGCEDPKVLFTLDHSGFGNGFGEGFTSIYMIADEFMVRSGRWEATLNIEKALKKEEEDLNVNVIWFTNNQNGFILALKGKKIESYRKELKAYAEKAASLIPNIEFYVNGKKVEKKNLFDIETDSKFVREFNNRKYRGKLSLVHNQYESYIKIYNEYRFVEKISFYGLSGTILLKPNAINLRTPDRRGIIFDRKREELLEQFEKDLKTLLKEMIRDGDSENIKKFSDVVNVYMDVEEYISYLTINSNSIKNQYEVRKEQKDTEEIPEESLTKLPENDFIENVSKEESKFHQEELSEEYEPEYNASIQSKEDVGAAEQVQKEVKTFTSNSVDTLNKQTVDRKRKKEDKKFTSYVISSPSRSFAKKEEMDKVSILNIKQKRNVVWVKKEEMSELKDIISKYEYYGIYTFVSPHVLYDNALEHIGIPHISSVEKEAIKKEYRVTKIGARSKKEERAMELLGFIEQEFGLSETFNISTIEGKMIVKLRGTKIYQEKLDIHGYCQGREIHLNRRKLKTGKLSSLSLGSKKLGIHDIKFIMGNLDTIAHELAHRIYGTEDNTKEHFEKQILIQNKISKMVFNN